MKLVFYSGYDENNAAIDRELVRLIGKASPRITFIPSAYHAPDYEYRYFCENFSAYGFRNIEIFNVDQPYAPEHAEHALSADLVYLSGGNTFYFLKAIRKHHFDTLLKKYVERGGVLAGLSAGAILMTPTIATASYPKFDRDDNDVNLRNFDALELVHFEFFPHYTAQREYVRELKKQSKKLDIPLYGVDDGGGIVVEDDRVSFFGDVFCYLNGQEFKLF